MAADLKVAQADFAFDCLRLISENDEASSTVFSPASVALALTMVYAGAKNKSEEELRQILGKRSSSDDIYKHFSSLVAKLNNSTNEEVQLRTANKAYVEKNFKILESFRKCLSENNFAAFEDVEFQDAVNVVKAINGYVSENTGGKITDLLSTDDINQNTRLILINAIFFKGNWKSQFLPDETQMEVFYASENSHREIEMMNQREKFMYYEDENLQCLEMPYAGATMNAYFLLPRARYGLADLIKKINGREFLTNILSKLRRHDVKVKLPKFRVESKHSLKEILSSLGLRSIFSESEADLSNITGKRDLFVEKIIQKACIETDEYGSEAAAATAIIMCESCAAPEPERDFKFFADHPFIFMLIDSEQNIFFSGIIKKH